MNSAPVLATDIYSDAEILEPYATYAEVREMGPVVYLASHDAYALGRYKDVRTAGLNFRTFSSASGVSLNEMANNVVMEDGKGITIASDAPLHTKLRQIIGAPLLPPAVAQLRDTIQAAADELLDRLVARRQFDGVVDFARFLPVMIVSKLVGMPEDGCQNMLDWAAATFDIMGPMNDRAKLALPKFEEMLAYIADRAQPENLVPDSWAARIFAASDAGLISREQATMLLIDYLAPSLDTTIFASAHLIQLLGRHPDAWRKLREDGGLISSAIDECVRLESPIRGFSRMATEDVDVGGTMVAAGSRVLLLYASGNRDDRRWEKPEDFDIERDTSGHLGFGVGRHSCAGMHLARLEMAALMTAMIKRVRTFEVGDGVRAPNNLLRGLATLPVVILEAA